jgi:hypothetical protein
MSFLDLTQKQLIMATKKQIINAITNKLSTMSERRLKEFVWHLRDLIVEDLNYQEEVQVESKDNPNGQVLRVSELRDLMGNKVGSERIEWEYYPKEIFPDERIRFIRTRHFDKNDIEVIGQGREIEHLSDGKITSKLI